MTTEVAELGATEVVPGRAFTDLAHDAHDLARLEEARASLVALLAEPGRPDRFREVRRGPAGHEVTHHVNFAAAGREAREPFLVGFCGFVPEGADRAEAERLDAALIASFPEHPGLYSYNVLGNDDGNFVNLIMFRDRAAVDAWSGSPVHDHAAHVFSLDFYSEVRIHNLRLAGGLAAAAEPLVLTRTNYYDFSARPPWKAIRDRA